MLLPGGLPFLPMDGMWRSIPSSTNLVPNDTNGMTDVFLRDTVLHTTIRVSVDFNGTQADGRSMAPSISADGNHIAFLSEASNLVSGTQNLDPNLIYVHHVESGITELASANSQGEPAVSGLHFTLSLNGNYLTFASAYSNVVEGDTNNSNDVFVRNLQTGQTVRISVDSAGLQGNSSSGAPYITNDGRYVIFASNATNLVNGDTNNYTDLFVHDLQTGLTSLVSVSSSGEQGNDYSGEWRLGLSNDGRYAIFDSVASNLVEGDTNNACDIFLHDLVTGVTSRLSVGLDGAEGNYDFIGPSISANGQFVAFESGADNLVENDTNEYPDIFVVRLSEITKIYLPLIIR